MSNTTSDHKAYAGTASSAAAVYTVSKNGSSLFSVNYASGSLTGSFTLNGPTLLSASVGEYITVSAPATVDITLADVYFTLKGTI
jgi:hypothetical protein